MGDSQNWSSFDDEPPKRKAPAPPAPAASASGGDGGEGAAKAGGAAFGIKPVDLRNLRNRLVFGGLVGFCTGATFGTIDAIKVYQKVHGRVALAAVNSVARGAAISGGAFAGFFLAYQGVKTVMEVQRGEEDLVNVGVATVLAGAPFLRSNILRQNIPYALMLVALDHFHEEINEVRR